MALRSAESNRTNEITREQRVRKQGSGDQSGTAAVGVTPGGDHHHRLGLQRGADWPQRWYMPILFMALMALGVFVAMGLMLFYAAYAEGHDRKLEKRIAARAADQGKKAATIRA